MKKLVLSLLFVASTNIAFATESDPTSLGHAYFDAWVASQAPQATEQDLENYLALLADDVGHQHLPYAADDTRYESGKSDMRKGMMYYLGAHSHYAAELISVTEGFNVVVIKYATESAGTHPQTGQVIELNYDTIKVLEIEDGKVSVIRKYAD